MLKMLKRREQAPVERAEALVTTHTAMTEAELAALLDELEQDVADVQPIGRVEYELKRLDVKIEVLEAEKKSAEEQIAALQTELREINQILKSDILKRRELMTDKSYSPEKDSAGSHAVGTEEKRKRGDKAWPAKVEAAA